MKNFALILFLSVGIAFSSSEIFAKDCPYKITGTDQMQFDLKEMRIPKDCDTIKVTIVTSGKMPLMAMGHNWVLAKESDWKAIAQAETKMPSSAAYVPTDKRIIAATTFVGGGANEPKAASVTIKRSSLKDGERYHYFCSFPGHFALMNGAFILEK